MIIHKSNTGEIAIMMIVGNDKESAIKNFQEQHPEFTSYYEGDFKLPSERTFRDAWTIQDNKIVIDKQKAKAIHLERIREARNKKLEELDKKQLRHLADPGMAVEIEQKKQLLRQLPDNLVVDITKWPVELA